MARRPNALDQDEMAVLHEAIGGQGYKAAFSLFVIVVIGASICIEAALGVPLGLFFRSLPTIAVLFGAFPTIVVLFGAIHTLRYIQVAAIKKVLGFNPTKQDIADVVVAEFEELRVTRTELIGGYGTDAPRIPLRGLTATVRNTGAKTDHGDDRRVHIAIEGPDTKFAYSAVAHRAFDARVSWLAGRGYTTMNARQFAALLNYEASLQGAPPKKVQESRPTTSGAPQTDATTTNVGCPNCGHVQTVPRSEAKFVCEQCNEHLTRRTQPDMGSSTRQEPFFFN